MDILPQILVNGIIQGSVIALIALGLSLIYGVLKFMNFAHGDIAMLGAYFYYLFFISLEWAIIPSLIAAVCLCGIVGILFNKLVFHPLRKESEWTLLITSIGVSIFLKSMVLLIATGKARNYAQGGYDPTVYKFFDGKMIITNYQILLLISTAIILIGLAFFLKYSKTGKAIRAVSDNMNIASILGINVKKTILLIFIISTCIAGFSGVLIGYEQSLSPNMGITLSVLAFAAVVVGGLGSIWGAVIGGFALGIISNLIIGMDWWGFSVPTNYRSAIAFGILIIILIIRPRGLFGPKLEEEMGRK